MWRGLKMDSIKINTPIEYKGVTFTVTGEYGANKYRCDVGWIDYDITVRGVTLRPILSHPVIRAILNRVEGGPLIRAGLKTETG
jgi:hypothetical protein